MEFWTFITILGGGALIFGAIAALAVLAPGLFTSIVNIMRSIFEFMINHLPKPLKYLLVIVLILSTGSIITYTVGLQYVCLNDGSGDDVYKVPMFAGLALQSWTNLDGDLARVTISDENIREHNLYRFETNDDNQTVSVMGLVAKSEIVSEFLSSDYTRVPPTEQFEKFLGDTEAVYDVCQEGLISDIFDANTCTLVRREAGTTPCSTGALRAAVGESVGRLTYTIEDITDIRNRSTLYDGHVSVGFIGPTFSGWVGALFGSPLSSCEESEEFTEEFGPPLPIHVVQERWYGDKEWDFIVYNADYFELMRSQKKQADIEAGTFFWETPDTVVYELIENIIGGDAAQKVDYERGDAIEFVCDYDTPAEDTPYDTKMLVLGVNPFDPFVILLFFLIGAVLAIYKWFDI